MCSSYVDSDIYAEWLNINSSNILFKLFMDAIRDSITSQTYKKQAYILKTIISKKKRFNEMPDGLIIIHFSCKVHYMYQQLFKKFPSCTEVKEYLFCSYCQIK
jgi:hypothetical protein